MVISPVVAPVGTVVTIWVAELLMTVAGIPLKVTALLDGVVESKLVPVMLIMVPTAPLPGEKVGWGSTVKLVGEVISGPPSVLVIICPVVAAKGTVTTIMVALLLVAGTGSPPLNITKLSAGVVSNPVPYMVSAVPGEAPAAESPVMVCVGEFPHPEITEMKQTSAPKNLNFLGIPTPFLDW